MRRNRLSPIATMFWLVLAGLTICGCGQQRSGPSLQDLDIDALAAEATAAMEALGKEQPLAVGTPKGDRPAALRLEKTKLKFGFIKLTDCAPLVIAKEQGFFADEGLQVDVEAQPNWKTLLERVISGELDGAHMLSGQPIASTIGVNGEAHVITAYTMDLNGNGITVSNAIWEQMQKADPALQSPQAKHPISADALRPIVAERKASGDLLKMGMVFPVSTHNYELRYWLAASGIHPGMYTASDTTGVTDAEVLLSVTPPPMMPQVMEVGTIQGYCVGEPWNQQAVVKGIGVPVTTNYDIWKNNPEKVFGVTKAWNDENRNTHIAVVKALIRAGKWLDETDAEGKFVNREAAVQLLSKANYVGADVDVIRNSMTGYFYFQKSDKRELPDFNVFFKYHATYPWYSDGVWFLTQMRRWGQITEPKPAEWYDETAKKIYRPDIYREAADRLIAEGKLDRADIPADDTDGYKPATSDFIDGIPYDGHDPIAYLNSHKIGNKDE
ncbi:ABC transporter substrate-binding protein [Blastopirellula sp. JC732]|uniref:ABC transporter substrate-binding protein n=2 Tax=Blastopirellula sediminis TaxID=2894196 RepID=A0A9X1SEX7_9BACT|nr:CmpA/NrtA family ABC transporter substrate-binding protein [Blastopirellula sediminis]MCC9627041.1 ABC transporter substrate-binding protein [Blastopirellula sediminis]